MKSNIFIALSLCFSFALFTSNSAKAQSGCCPLPDSLTVTSVTDSSFCVKWRISDSIHCDTPKAAILVYRPIGAANWTTVRIFYGSGQVFGTSCDSITSCLKYQWKVRNVCIKNGDTTFTDYVKGPNFTANCDTTLFVKNASKSGSSSLQVFPNPAHTSITLKGSFESASKVKVIITDMQGNSKLQREVSLVNGVLHMSFDAVTWNKGVYFITISDGKKTIKQNFIKE